MTFLDNHDVKQRLRYVQPDGTSPFDDQVTLALACLFSLPGIPCVYYGTEQGLHGAGTDAAVREALWGGPGLDQNSAFYGGVSAIAAVRNELPALRYGRFYMRLSGDGVNYGLSTVAPGVIAFSRILAGQEVVVVANTHPTMSQALDVIVDRELNPESTRLVIRYSNKSLPMTPEPLRSRQGVLVHEPGGGTTGGPVMTSRVTLLPMEAQILTSRSSA